MLISEKIEREIIGQLAQDMGRRPGSQEISVFSRDLFNQHLRSRSVSFISNILLRLSIKSNPYDACITDTIAVYREITHQLVRREMPALVEWISLCESKGLPLPVIISCGKYLDKARDARRSLQRRYFDIAPIIVRGDDRCVAAHFDNQILCLPVSDTYEALPSKVLETWTLLEILGGRHGVIKIDDDLDIVEGPPLNIEQVRTEFTRSDYMGVPVTSLLHDRAWHWGKCASAVPPIYGKPFLAPWARGALYFLSKKALKTICSQYLRFPGCLDGEFYEDKVVGDMLHEFGIQVMDNPIEIILKLRTEAHDPTFLAAG